MEVGHKSGRDMNKEHDRASEEPLGRFFGINRMALGEHEVLSKSEGNRRLSHGKTKKSHPPRGGGRG